MKKLITLANLLCLIGLAVPAQAQTEEATVKGSTVVVQHTEYDTRVSMRFEVKGEKTEIKNCTATIDFASRFAEECQSLGVFSTKDVASLLEEGWVNTILANLEQGGVAVTSGTLAAASVYFTISKLTKGAVSEPVYNTIFSNLKYSSTLFSTLLGASVGFWGYEQTARGEETRQLLAKNDLADSLRDGDTVFETMSLESVTELFTFFAGQSSLLAE